MRAALLIACAAAAPAFVGPAPAAADTCQPFPSEHLGLYRSWPYGSTWRLRLTSVCTFTATEAGSMQGAGTYAVSGATITFSNDAGCVKPGDSDVPTDYGYAFKGDILTLTPPPSDTCSDRAHDLAGHAWVKLFKGSVTIALKGSRFTVIGAIVDAGSITRLKTGLTLHGAKGDLRVRLAGTAWKLAGGTLSYSGAFGAGRATPTALRGTVYN
jgi:hypothetical protein